MSEIVIIAFRIEDGEITEVAERPECMLWTGLTRGGMWAILTERGDIEDAVARVANTPVGGEGDET